MNKKVSLVLRIVAGACEKANSSPVAEKSTSPAVSTKYGSAIHQTEIAGVPAAAISRSRGNAFFFRAEISRAPRGNAL